MVRYGEVYITSSFNSVTLSLSLSLSLSLCSDNRLEDDFMFEDSFNPQTAKTNPPPEPEKPKSQNEFNSPDLAAPHDTAPSPYCPVKCEITCPVKIEKEPDTVVAEPKPEAVSTKEESDKPVTVKLGKRSAGERVNEFLECLAKVKRESGDDSATVAAWKNATEKENKVMKKEEKR